MRFQTYKYILLITFFVAFISCKSQSGRVNFRNESTNQTVVDSVAYEIIKDSIYCKLINDKYEFESLKIKHVNKSVEERINVAILSGNSISDNYSYKDLYAKYKDSLSLSCKEINTNYLNEFGGYYEITYNENTLLSILCEKEYYLDPTSKLYYFNFNTKTGSILKNR